MRISIDPVMEYETSIMNAPAEKFIKALRLLESIYGLRRGYIPFIERVLKEPTKIRRMMRPNNVLALFGFDLELFARTNITKRKYYPFIPYEMNRFLRHLENPNFRMADAERIRFIDIGSGIGACLALAKFYYPVIKVFGIELDGTLTNISKRLLQNSVVPNMTQYRDINPGTREHVFNMDVFKKKTFPYNRIYTYMPIQNVDLRMEMYVHVWNKLPRGARWLEVGDTHILKAALDEGKCKYKIPPRKNVDHKMIFLKP
jgi:hypothetical protein